MKNTPLVSLALIAGPAEGEILFRLIQSAKGLWDEVIVVAATGSQPHDDLKKALQDAAGEAGTFAVYHNAPENSGWPHIDNFAAARNQAFSLARGKYVLWADCDDLFPPAQAGAHRAAIEDREQGRESWDLLVTSYDVQNAGMRAVTRERIFRRHEDGRLRVFWERSVHERIRPDPGLRIGVARDLVILHAPAGPKTSSKERNHRILGRALEGVGMSIYYVAQEHFLKGDYPAAIGSCLLALEHPDVGGVEKYQLHCQASVMLADRAKRLEHLGKAITISPVRREAHGLLAADRMDHGDFASALEILRRVEDLPPTGDWNQEHRWYRHLPRQLLGQCLRALGRADEARRSDREAFQAAGGKITVLHAGEPEDCLKSLGLYDATADNAAGIQHLLITKPGHKLADRHVLVRSAEEAMDLCLGEIILSVKAKDAPLPGLRWDAALLGQGTVPPGSERLPSIPENDPAGCTAVISVCHATRGRPEQAALARARWLARASRPELVEWIFSCDDDDATASRLAPWEPLQGPGGCVAAWNRAAEKSRGDILIQGSDDWDPPAGWDHLVRRRLGDVSRPAVLAVSDGHRKDRLLCLAILTRARWEKQGRVMFAPEYDACSGLYSDNEFTERAYADGCVVEARDILFRHDNPFFTGQKPDAEFQRHNNPKNYEAGRKIYQARNPAKA